MTARQPAHGTDRAVRWHQQRQEPLCWPCSGAYDRALTRWQAAAEQYKARQRFALPPAPPTTSDHLRRCWHCGEWCYRQQPCGTCTAPAIRTADRETA